MYHGIEGLMLESWIIGQNQTIPRARSGRPVTADPAPQPFARPRDGASRSPLG